MKMHHCVGLMVLAFLTAFPLSSISQDACPHQLDIVLLIDQSGSILTSSSQGVTIWDDVILDFSAQLALALPISPQSVRMGVVKFSTGARVAITLNEYPDSKSLELAIRDLEYGGGETNIADGLSVARNLLNDPNNGARVGIPKIVVLISDGKANINKTRTVPEANITKAGGVEIFCIGVTNKTDIAGLMEIASEPTSRHLSSLVDGDVMNRTLSEILDRLTCSADNPALSTSSTSSSTSSSTIHSTAIVNITSSFSTAPQPTTYTQCVRSADVALVIDESSGVFSNDPNWYNFITNYTTRLVTALPVSPTMVRIGVVTFSSSARIIIDFGRYSSASALSQAIANTAFVPGSRDIGTALNTARNFLFNTNRGARGIYTKKVIFLLVNGRIAADTVYRTGVEAALTKAAGVEIFCVGSANRVSDAELLGIVSDPAAEHYSKTVDYNAANLDISTGLSGYCPLEKITTPSRTTRTSISSSATTTARHDETQQDVPLNLTTVATVNPPVTRTTATTTTTGSPSASTLTSLGSSSSNNPVTAITESTSTSMVIPTLSTSIQSTVISTPTNVPSSTLVSVLISPGTSSVVLENYSTSTAAQSTNVLAPNTVTSSTTSPRTSPATSTGTTATPMSSSSSTIASSTSSTPRFSTTSLLLTPPTLTTSTTSTMLTVSTMSSTSTTSTMASPSSSTTLTSTPQVSSLTSSSTIGLQLQTSTSTTTPQASTSTTTSTTSSTLSPTTTTTTTTTTTMSTSSTTTKPPTSSSSTMTPLSSPTTTEEATTSSSTTATTVMPCPKEIDIVLVLDETTSIVSPPGGYDNWYSYILGFAAGLVNAFQVDPNLVRIGVVKFSWFARIMITLDQYSDAATLSSALVNLTIDGGQTNIASGLRVGRQLLFNTSLGAREGVKKIIFLVTDGGANIEYENTQPEATTTKKQGVEIYCIGVTTSINVPELIGIATDPIATHYYFVNTYSLLQEVLVKLRGTICFALPFSSSSTAVSTKAASTRT